MKITRETTTTETREVETTTSEVLALNVEGIQRAGFTSPAKLGYGDYSVAGAFCQFVDPAFSAGFPYSKTLVAKGLAAAGVPAGRLSSGDTKLLTALAKDVVRKNSDGEFRNAWRALRRFIRTLDLLQRAHKS